MQVSFYLRAHRKDAQGECTLFLKLTHQGQRRLISTGKKIKPSDWDVKRQRLKPKAPRATEQNRGLAVRREQLEAIIDTLTEHGKPLSFDAVIAELPENKVHRETIARYGRERLRITGVAASTLKQYEQGLRLLERYHPDATFHEVDARFLGGFDHWLSREKYHRKSIEHAMKTLRRVFNLARDEGITSHYPFGRSGYKIRTPRDEREYLTLEELQRLQGLHDQGSLEPPVESVLRWFLFSCYTGLRRGDLMKLRPEHIRENRYIDLIMSKTGTRQTIPLSGPARDLLHSLFERRLRYNVNITNQRIKACCVMVDIHRNITFHTARHTFAVCSKALGMDSAVLQRLMGHASYSTTQIYAKIVDEAVETGMNVWNQTEKKEEDS